ncbi:MAG: PEP-CTERM sorting domain-containing protein [Planctomycetota bacterium]|jgi:xanthosine utilization system XapX-like protein
MIAALIAASEVPEPPAIALVGVAALFVALILFTRRNRS